MEICKEVAVSGATVVMVVHQPTGKAFGLMDQVIFLKDGRSMYQGLGNDMGQYLDSCGFPIPESHNPAEWIMDVALSNDTSELEKAGLFSFDEGVLTSHKSDHAGRRGSRSSFQRLSIFENLPPSDRVTLPTEYWNLVARGFHGFSRNKATTGRRLGIIAFGAVVHATCFAGVGRDSFEDPIAFQSHVSAVFLACMATMFVLMLSLLEVNDTIPLFYQEYTGDFFRFPSYALSVVTMELFISILQTVIFVPIVYFGMAFTGSLQVVTLAGLLFTQTNVALAQFVASLCRDPQNAIVAMPLILLPSVLMSGILVDTNSIPSWLRWMQTIFPLSYFARIIIGNEFADDCFDFSVEEEHAANCLEALSNAVDSVEFGTGRVRWYDEKSTMSVPFTGIYKGPRAIIEYGNFFSTADDPNASIWFVCDIAGEFLVNFESSDDSCVLTIASVHQVLLNQDKVRTDLKGVGDLMQFVFGQKLHYSYANDLSSITIANHDLYFPEPVVNYIVGSGDSDLIAKDVCQEMQDQCPEVYQANNFGSFDNCTSIMAMKPSATVNERGLATIDGDSLGCRNIHASMARQDPSGHCPHLSVVPMPDANNFFKCQKEGEFNLLPSDFFDESDLTMFEFMATSVGMDKTDQYRLIEESEMGECALEFSDYITPSVVASIDELPATVYCAQYLQSINATGSEDLKYWMILVGMFFLFRTSAFAVLRFKAARM